MCSRYFWIEATYVLANFPSIHSAGNKPSEITTNAEFSSKYQSDPLNWHRGAKLKCLSDFIQVTKVMEKKTFLFRYSFMDIFNNVMKLLPAKKQPKTLLRIMCQNLHDVKCLQKWHDARFPSIILFCLIKSYLMTTNLHFYAGLLQNGGPGCGKAPDSASPAAAWLTGRHHQAGPPQTHAESCICKHLYLKTYEVATTFICQKYFFATAERV